jgi:uncharacterized repeat protein (TIGR03806 family)
MRWAKVTVLLAGCVAQPPAGDGADTDRPVIDTAATDPVCAGLGQPCEALPARPDSVGCGAGLRDAVRGDAPWTWPGSLAELGCFDDVHALSPTAGVLAYEVRAPLFSNGSDKGRYLALPPGGTITPSADGAWVFPTGTLLLKSFGLDLAVEGARAPRTIEVRVMLLAQDGWKFSTYAWDEAAQDLRLVGEKGRTDALVLPHDDGDVLAWYYPSVEACLTCHRTVGEQVLAVRTRQLHHRVDYGDWVADQLVAWDAIGVFSPSIATLGALPTVADPYSPRTPAEPRARAWLHANCAHCHQPGGFAPPELSLDLRVTTPLADTATCLVPKHSGFTTGGEYVIVPGDASASALVQRIRTESFEKMPPDGATRYDEGGIQAVEAWINGLDGCP